MIYYQSYQPVTHGQLISATTILEVEGNLTGKQDCLGMTPLHILACSTVQNIEVYIVLVTKYPEALVTEDIDGEQYLYFMQYMGECTR